MLQYSNNLTEMADKQSLTTSKYKMHQADKTKKTTTKTSKDPTPFNIGKQQQIIENLEARFEFHYHPAAKYLMGTNPTHAEFKKFISYFYQGLYYSLCNLRGPSQEYIRKKSIKLPERKDSTRKFLMLDLDETLIHSVFTHQKTQISFKQGQDTFRFNVRPHCLQFLDRMSEHYDIYVFTASTEDYAHPIIEFLNKKKKTILGALTRKHCMETNNGFRIKDLRIIKNRCLTDIVMVDNLLHSFGLQIENGIPIIDFTNNKQDKQLLGLQKILLQMKNVTDVREYLAKKLQLKKCLDFEQAYFTEIKKEEEYISKA